jgi:nitrogen fixation NifU-like protein
MTQSAELYQEIILDHNRAPRNYRRLEQADREAQGYNPLCGDHLAVQLKLDGDSISDIGFQGSGCAISRASASLMTTVVKGKTTQEARQIFDSFQRLVTGKGGAADDLPPRLAVFAGVREFPIRVKCATLSWHALKAALEGRGGEQVSTE